MMKKIIAVAAFLLCSTAAQAGIVMGGTRVIYQEGKREAAISVTNADTHTPYLVQSWVENYAENDKSKVPFIVTPPLFRLDPEQNNVLRINFIGASLPGDRESVFWLNVKSISPTPQGEVNKLQVNIKSKFKIFYRPNGLAGDPAKAWQQLKFTKYGGHKLAAGLSMREEDIEPLRAALNKKCTLTEDDFIPKVHIDVAMPMGYADDALAGEFALLEPFGTGNPRPLFAQKGLVFQAGFKMGANKTCARFRVKTPEGTTQTVVFFGDLEKLGAFLDEKYGVGSEEALYAGKGNFPLSVVYQVSQNTYKGKTEVQFVMQNYC